MICRIDTRQDLPQGTDKVRAFLDRRQIPSNCGARRTFNWASDQPGLQLTSLDKIFYHNSDRPWHRIRHPSALRQITGIKLLLALAAAIAGIGTSFVIRKIVEPNHQWSAFFIRQYNHLPGTSRNAFSQCGMEKPTQRLLMRLIPGKLAN
jgi:hypothetical protein